MNNALRILPALPLILFFSCSLAQATGVMAKDTQQSASAHQPETLRSLAWKAKGNELTVTNTGKSAIDLERDVKLMPDEMPLTLVKTTLQPGETMQVYGACPEHLPRQNEVVVTPAGKSSQPQVLPIHHASE
ncbi:hypothetical protein [Cedecea sp.]|uniref:hypothetical protein n=1 Tax=Cedecea sp. TaxID=1970739 RepID=UPI002F42D112